MIPVLISIILLSGVARPAENLFAPKSSTPRRASPFADDDLLCGVQEGQAASAALGDKSGAVYVAPCNLLGTLVGTRVVAVCEGKVLSVVWNRVYTNAPISYQSVSVGRLDNISRDLQAIRDAMVLEGWRLLLEQSDTSDPPQWHDQRWIKEEEERMVKWEVVTEGDLGLIVLRVSTSKKAPCSEGI
ncbi:hypothetical protein L6R53_15765 [Myxococcota bacterium]|nr:hypothetical protein [Myxococcota bacterium]